MLGGSISPSPGDNGVVLTAVLCPFMTHALCVHLGVQAHSNYATLQLVRCPACPCRRKTETVMRKPPPPLSSSAMCLASTHFHRPCLRRERKGRRLPTIKIPQMTAAAMRLHHPCLLLHWLLHLLLHWLLHWWHLVKVIHILERWNNPELKLKSNVCNHGKKCAVHTSSEICYSVLLQNCQDICKRVKKRKPTIKM